MDTTSSARAAAAVLALQCVTTTAPSSVQPGNASGPAKVNGTSIYYETKGRGAPVVLIHGGNLDSRMWDPQFDLLAREFRVVRYDVRPYGRSEKTAPPSSVEDLRALLDFLSIDRAAIVGLSLGGRIAIDFALKYPDRVDRLVLAGPGLTGFEWTRDERLGPMMQAASSGDTTKAVELWLQHPYMAPAMANRAIAARVRQIAMDNRPVWSVRQVEEEVSNPPAAGRLKAIHVPVLVVVGTKDVPDIHTIARKLERDVLGAECVEVEGAGHMVNMEAPDRFNTVVHEFLGQANSRPDFSGEFEVSKTKSQFGLAALAALERGTVRLEHREPLFRLFRHFEVGGRQSDLSYELTTDGRDVTRKDDGRTLVSRLSWDRDTLIYSVRIVDAQGESTNVVRYRLLGKGRMLQAEERFRGPTTSYDNVWIFDRAKREGGRFPGGLAEPRGL